MTHRHVISGGRYPVLRALAILYVIAGAITALAGIAFAAYLLSEQGFGSDLDRIFMALGVLTLSFYLVISVFAVAELIKLIIDIEHNSRMAATGAAQMGMPQGIGVESVIGKSSATATVTNDGARWTTLDEETAEAALLRGH